MEAKKESEEQKTREKKKFKKIFSMHLIRMINK